MSRLYDALMALERKRPAVATTVLASISAEPRARHGRRAILVVVGALCVATTLTVVRSRATVPPAPEPAVDTARATRSVSAAELRLRAREANMLGLLDEAETLLRQAISQVPGDAVAWNDLGVVLAHRAQLTPAIEAFRSSLALDPKYAAAHRNLAVALERADRRVDAAAHYRLFISLATDGPDRALAEKRLAKRP